MALSQQIFSTTINIAGCIDCNLTNCLPSPWCSPLPSPAATTTIPYSPPENDSTKQSLSPIVIIVVGVLASLFLLVSYYAIIVKYCSSWDLARRPRRGNNDGTHDEIEENLNPLNQFWYVRTVGLDESIINSITVCKYKKDEGLIDGTECTVCLNEFREDEDLRLLPKCSHAFHLPCIDTWLNSHVNCPLCRASIVSNPPNSTSSLDQTVSDRVEAEPENILGLGNDRTEDLASATDVVADVNGERDVNLFETGKSSSPKEKSPFRVVSDLERNYGSHETVVGMIDEIQPVRRSFSMDDSSSTISSALANLHRTCSTGSSTDQESAIGKSPLDHKKFNFGEFSGLKAIILKHSGNPIKSKQWGNVLGEPSQQLDPIAMKRSFSSSSKFFLSGYSRSRNSILPL